MNRIYCLNWDYNHSGDSERDAYHIPFQDSNKASTLFLNPRYKDKLPQKLMFRANFSVIPIIDYPLTDLDIPILSDRMIGLLNSLGSFDAIYTDVIMIDDTYLGNIFDARGMLKPEINTTINYKALTIVKRENCFDFENSIFMPSELNPNIPGYIEKLVLKCNYPFPPIFRIKESPSKLLITENAKSIIENNNIKGCVFEEVESI